MQLITFRFCPFRMKFLQILCLLNTGPEHSGSNLVFEMSYSHMKASELKFAVRRSLGIKACASDSFRVTESSQISTTLSDINIMILEKFLQQLE